MRIFKYLESLKLYTECTNCDSSATKLLADYETIQNKLVKWSRHVEHIFLSYCWCCFRLRLRLHSHRHHHHRRSCRHFFHCAFWLKFMGRLLDAAIGTVEIKIIYKHFYYAAYCERAQNMAMFHILITPQLVRSVCYNFLCSFYECCCI